MQTSGPHFPRHNRQKSNQQTTKSGGSVYDKFLSIDKFGETFQLRVSKKGDKTKTSVTGAICSLLLLGVIIAYTA